MNCIYRTIWSDVAGSFVAVAETARAHGKRQGSISRRTSLGITAVSLGLFQLNAIAASLGPNTATTEVITKPSPAKLHLDTPVVTTVTASPLIAPTTLPGNASIVSGNIAITSNTTPTTAVMNINQSSKTGIINWGSFNIGSAATVNFNQPDAQASTLNRVQSADISQILGKMNATGQVFIINPSGILFGKTSQVNVGGIVATTHQLSDSDYLAGRTLFSRNGSSAAVINEGNITTAIAGYAALLAPEVRNDGVILARQGTVALASGEGIALQFEGSSLIGMTVTPSTIASLVQNQRAVLAPGGLIILSAKSIGQLASGVIQNSGTLSATGTKLVNGHIRLQASDQITLSGNSTIDVSNNDGVGGDITLSANQIHLSDYAKISATGITGGKVIIEAESTSTDTLADQTPVITLAATAMIDASATGPRGEGGDIDLRADNGKITIHGTIVSDGNGSNTDSGHIIIGRNTDTGALAASTDVSNAHLQAKNGLVETSGDFLKSDGVTVRGKTWLLDPNNVEILATSSSTPYIYGDSVVSASQIATALGNGTSVTISTGGTGTTNASVTSSPTAGQVSINGTGTQSWGNILVGSPINVTAAAGVSWSANAAPTLTLNANNAISVLAPISASGTFANGTTYATNPTSINVAMTANGINNDPFSGIKIDGSGAINWSLWGISISNLPSNGAISTNGGIVTINGTGNASQRGVELFGPTSTPVITSDQIIMNGTSVAAGIELGGSLAVTNLNNRNLTSTITGTSSNNNGSYGWGPSYGALEIGNTTLSAASGTTLSLIGNATSIGTGHDTYGMNGVIEFAGNTLTTSGNVSISGFSGSYRAVNLLGTINESANSSLTITGTQMSNVTAYADIHAVYMDGSLTAGNGSSLSIVGNSYAAPGSGTNGGDGVYIAGSMTGAAGALSITGSSTYANGIQVIAPISGWGNTTLIGTSLSPNYASVYVGSTSINVGTHNLFIQSNGTYFGSINLSYSTLTAGNVSLDNSGGVINSVTGAITPGNAIASSSFGSDIYSINSTINASGNVNIYGQNSPGSTSSPVQIGSGTSSAPISGASITINGKIAAGSMSSNGVLTNGAVIGTAPTSTANNSGNNGFYNGVNPLSAFTLANNGATITNANGTTASTATVNISRSDTVNYASNSYLYAVNRLENNGTYTVYMVEVTYNSALSGSVYAVSAAPTTARILSGQASPATNATLLSGYWGAAASPTASGTTTVGPNGISILGYTTNAAIFGASGGSGSTTVSSSTVPTGSVGNANSVEIIGTSTLTTPLLKATGNITISGNQGNVTLIDYTSIASTSISGANISIDNTNGIIDSITGAITTGSGAGGQGSSPGVLLSGGSIAAAGNLNIAGINTSSTTNVIGTQVSSSLTSSGGAINITGAATNSSTAYGVFVSQPVMDTLTNGVITISGKSGLSSGTDYAVSVGANVGSTANANNVVIQSLNGSQIAHTAGTIAGNYVSIDNTGGTDSEGIINAPNTANPLSMTWGAGLTLTGAGISATSGINLFGNSTNASGVKVQEGVSSGGYLTIAGNSAGVSTQGVYTSTALSANGAISITGNNTNTSASNTGNGVSIGATITDTNTNSNVTIQGSTAGGASAASGNAIILNGNIAAGTNNVILQSTNGSMIYQHTGTITGNNISIDNTNGTINASTGVITNGTASASSSTGTNGINLVGGAITASGNMNISGATNSSNSTGISLATALTSSGGNISLNGNNTVLSGYITGSGINIASNASVTDTWANPSIINIQGHTAGSTAAIKNAAPIIAQTAGSSINLTSTGNAGITGNGAIGSSTYNKANVTFSQTGNSTYDGATNASNLTMSGGGTLTLDSWTYSTPANTNISNAYTVQGGSTLQLNTSASSPLTGPSTVNVNNASVFSLNTTGSSNWTNASFNFTGTSGGGTINFTGNPIGGGSTQFSTNGGATDTINGLWNANNNSLTLNLAAATSGTLGSTGSYVALAFASSGSSGIGISNASVINVNGGGGVLFKSGISGSAGNSLNINAGYVQVGDGTSVTSNFTESLGVSTVNIATGSALAFDRAEAVSSNLIFTGAGNLTQAGAGALTLTGASTTFAGTTSINSGKTLNVNSGGTLGSSSITLNNGANFNITQTTDTTINNAISGNGNVSATITGNLTLNTPINLTTGGSVNFSASGTLTTNNSIVSVAGTSLTGTNGVALNSNITNTASGNITVAAGNGTAASTATLAAASGATISQAGTGNVVLSTDGQGNLTTAKILNSGSGNVSLIAGKLLSAGTTTGGQITTLNGNTVSNSGGGNLYLYTGDAATTGNLSYLNSALTTLSLSGSSLNTAFNTAYGSGNTIAGGGTTQAMFRSTTAPAFSLALASIAKVYGQSDPTLNSAFQTAYTAAGNPATLTTTSGNNTFSVSAATLIANMSGSRLAGENVSTGPYAYTLRGNGLFSNDIITGGSLTITPANLSATGTAIYNGTSNFSGSDLIITGVNGETFTATGTGTLLNAGNVQTSQPLSSTAGLILSGVGGALTSNYNPIVASQTSVSITPATATINATKTYDSTTSLTSGLVNIIGVNGQTLNYTGTASANNANVFANGSNYVSGITGLTNGTGLASNYVLPSLTTNSSANSVTINQATATINATKTYDSTTNLSSGQVNITGINGQTLNYTGTAAANNANVFANGSNYVSGITGLTNGTGLASNYVLPSLTTNSSANSVTINQVTATINATKTYDSTTSLTSGQVNITGINGQTLNYTGTASANNANVAANGSNYVSGITGLADGTGLASNYVLPSLSSASLNNKATINAVTTAVNIIGNSQSGTYNGNQQSIGGFTATGLVGTDTAANISGFAATGAIGTNAGSYTNIVNGNNSNYSNIIFTNGTLNIDRAIATINATKTYDSTTNLTSGQVNITGVNGQTLNYTGTASANNANVVANGSNYVSGITGLADGTGLASNYVLPSLSNASFNNKATINAVTTAVNIIGNSQSGTYNGNQQNVSGFTATGLVGTDTAANISGITSSGATGTNAGSYTNTVSGSNSNYSNIIFTNGTLNIDRAIATINATKTYDSTTNLNAGQISVTGVNGQTLNYTGTASANNANVAANGSNYVSGITGLADGTGLASNYVLPSLSSASFNNKATINAVTTAVNIIGNSQSGTYNGNQQSIGGFTATGLVGTDTAANISGFAATGAIGTNAGSYTNIVNGNNSNYSNIIFTNGTLNIDRAIATINATKTYDSTTSLTSGQVNITGVNGQTLNYTGTAVANNANVAANGSNYVSGITGLADGTGLASNYILPSLSAVSQNNRVMISAADLTIAANNVTKTAGDHTVLTGFTTNGLQGLDTIDTVTMVSNGSGSGAAPGTYAIIASDAIGRRFDPANYAIHYVAGKLSVKPAPATPTPSVPVTNEGSTARLNLPIALAYNDVVSMKTLTLAPVFQADSFLFTLPANTFAQSDKTTPLALEASLANGESLPSWLQFDAETGALKVRPPIGVKKMDVIITATDPNGTQAQTKLTLVFNGTILVVNEGASF